MCTLSVGLLQKAYRRNCPVEQSTEGRKGRLMQFPNYFHFPLAKVCHTGLSSGLLVTPQEGRSHAQRCGIAANSERQRGNSDQIGLVYFSLDSSQLRKLGKSSSSVEQETDSTFERRKQTGESEEALRVCVQYSFITSKSKVNTSNR